MHVDRVAIQWVVLALACGVALHAFDFHSFVRPSSVGDLFLHTPPFRAEFSGELTHFRISSGAWVFDVVNEGAITCYFRHPPSVISVFNHDTVLVRGRVESTPRGRLCVVEELISHSSTP